MRTLLALAIFIALTTSAYAEGNKIIVINKDGTVSSVDAAPPSMLRKGSATPPAPPSRPAEAASPAVKPVKKPAAQKQAVKKEAPVQKAAAPKQKKEAKKVDQKKSARAKSTPAPAPAVMSPRPSAAPSRPQRLGPQMTPEDAIRIALDVAPPARTVNAYPVNHNGIHAYQVIFATEEGDRFVFVDRETGKIIK